MSALPPGTARSSGRETHGKLRGTTSWKHPQADDPAQFAARMERLARMLAREYGPGAQPFLVESFLPGVEVALEGMLDGGELTVLALFDKPDPLDGPFFEETIYVTPSRLAQEVQAAIAACAGRTAAVAGIEGVEMSVALHHTVTPLPEGKSYLGFIFARGETPGAVEAALREAHGKLRFTIVPEIDVQLLATAVQVRGGRATGPRGKTIVHQLAICKVEDGQPVLPVAYNAHVAGQKPLTLHAERSSIYRADLCLW